MARRKTQHQHYRLEEPGTGLGVAQTMAGYRLVAPRDADRFPSLNEALVAAGAAPIEPVRVDA